MTRANGSRLTIAISVIAMGLSFLQPRLACAREGSRPAQVNVSPIVESVADTFATHRRVSVGAGQALA